MLSGVFVFGELAWESCLRNSAWGGVPIERSGLNDILFQRVDILIGGDTGLRWSRLHL